jgi:hypothetical protein
MKERRFAFVNNHFFLFILFEKLLGMCAAPVASETK